LGIFLQGSLSLLAEQILPKEDLLAWQTDGMLATLLAPQPIAKGRPGGEGRVSIKKQATGFGETPGVDEEIVIAG
jgi:hypothetical protein